MVQPHDFLKGFLGMPGVTGPDHTAAQVPAQSQSVTGRDPLPVPDPPGQPDHALLTVPGVHPARGLQPARLLVDLGVEVPCDVSAGLVLVDDGLPVDAGFLEILLPLECPVGPEMPELGCGVSPGCGRVFPGCGAGHGLSSQNMKRPRRPVLRGLCGVRPGALGGPGVSQGAGYSRRLSSCMKRTCSRLAASRAVLEIDSPMTAG